MAFYLPARSKPHRYSLAEIADKDLRLVNTVVLPLPYRFTRPCIVNNEVWFVRHDGTVLRCHSKSGQVLGEGPQIAHKGSIHQFFSTPTADMIFLATTEGLLLVRNLGSEVITLDSRYEYLDVLYDDPYIAGLCVTSEMQVRVNAINYTTTFSYQFREFAMPFYLPVVMKTFNKQQPTFCTRTLVDDFYVANPFDHKVYRTKCTGPVKSVLTTDSQGRPFASPFIAAWDHLSFVVCDPGDRKVHLVDIVTNKKSSIRIGECVFNPISAVITRADRILVLGNTKAGENLCMFVYSTSEVDVDSEAESDLKAQPGERASTSQS